MPIRNKNPFYIYNFQYSIVISIRILFPIVKMFNNTVKIIVLYDVNYYANVANDRTSWQIPGGKWIEFRNERDAISTGIYLRIWGIEIRQVFIDSS
jgi:hypothetical protein